MIGETGERKSAVATPDGKSRKKKKKKRVKASQNSIVKAICASDIWWKSSIRANWNKLLYVHNAGQGIG